MSQARVNDCDGLVAEAGCNPGALSVPADLENAASPFEGPHKGTALHGPDVELLVKAAAGQPEAIGAEGHRVDRVGVLYEGTDTGSCVHLP